MPKFIVRVTEVLNGEEQRVSTEYVATLREGEDTAQALLNLFAEEFQPGVKIVQLPEGGAQVYQSPSR